MPPPLCMTTLFHSLPFWPVWHGWPIHPTLPLQAGRLCQDIAKWTWLTATALDTSPSLLVLMADHLNIRLPLNSWSLKNLPVWVMPISRWSISFRILPFLLSGFGEVQKRRLLDSLFSLLFEVGTIYGRNEQNRSPAKNIKISRLISRQLTYAMQVDIIPLVAALMAAKQVKLPQLYNNFD